jgi:hypothetical protein
MQDFSWSYWAVLSPAAAGEAPDNELATPFVEEDLIGSPSKMYMYSMATRRRLPRRLHDAMLLWAFDPEHSPCVQMYLEWSDHCEKMNLYMAKHAERMRRIDRLMMFSTFATGVLLAFIIFLGTV